MAQVETNFQEILLRQTMIGMTIYLDDGTPFLIEEINYQPRTNQIFIKNAEGDSHNLPANMHFDFDYSTLEKIVPNKVKIMGKKER